MKIYNEYKQTISQRDDITIQSLHIRIRAKRFSGLKRRIYGLVEQSLKEVTW